MSTAMIWQTNTTSSADTETLGEKLGRLLEGGEVLDLVSDLGGGKTTFVRGLARGMDIKDTISSPTFTLSRIYKTKKGLELHHFDFYRLNEPGVLADQLAEALENKQAVTVIEWSDIVQGVLPENRITIMFEPEEIDADTRRITFQYTPESEKIIRQLETLSMEEKP